MADDNKPPASSEDEFEKLQDTQRGLSAATAALSTSETNQRELARLNALYRDARLSTGLDRQNMLEGRAPPLRKKPDPSPQ